MVFLTVSEVMTIHQTQIDEFGGASGTRDEVALLSAINRPQSGYYESILEMAAALWESLSQNHPFVDGNKRTAFAATDVFLRSNGFQISASPDEVIAFLEHHYNAGTFKFSELNAWLANHTVPR